METAVGGDLVLSARPVTAEAFAPYGRLLFPGERLRMGAAGKIVLALDPREAGPRRVRHLQRYVDARRFLMSIGEGSLLLVVAGVGDKPVGPAAAFRIAPGVGVLLEAGVWHAGPVAIADATVLEGLEAVGLADRLDRRTVADAFGAEGLRIMMPDEVGAPGPGLDLSAEFSVTVDERLRDRLLLGCIAFDGITVAETGADLRDEGDRLVAELRRQWGSAASPSDIPALEPARALYRGLGIDPTRTRPASEALLRRVLQGRPLFRVNSLVDAMNLCSLRMLVPFGTYDRGRIAGAIVLRVGNEGEGYEGIARGRIGVEGRPVLADREGAFGNPTADSLRTSVTHATSRALVVLYLPPTVERPNVERLLDATSRTVTTHCGGRESARRIVP